MWAIFAEAGHFGLTLGLFVMGNFTEHSKGFFFFLGTFVWPSSVCYHIVFQRVFFLGTWSCDYSLATCILLYYNLYLR